MKEAEKTVKGGSLPQPNLQSVKKDFFFTHALNSVQPMHSPSLGVGVLPSPATPPNFAQHIAWTENGENCSALWRSERGANAPTKVILADDTMTADAAYQLACGGCALLWRGDFHNARQLLQALARRIDTPTARKKRGPAKPIATMPHAFHLHRQAQAQRAKILGMVLVPFNADYSVTLRRAPDVRLACTQVWGDIVASDGASVASLRDLLAMVSAHEWRKKGVEIPSLGMAPNNRIYPHYGVFSPVRGEYIALVASTALPKAEHTGQNLRAFDIGVGSGVLSAVLARRQVQHIIATDQDPRALSCAKANMAQLGLSQQVELRQTNLFPEGRASLIVCNPPWLPARPSAPIEHAVYDENSGMLLGFLAGLAAHLEPHGEGWLILSDLAEHLGLRTRTELLAAITQGGLRVLERLDSQPLHPKAHDQTDPLHAARSVEVTSLWRLGLLDQSTGKY